MKLNRALDCKRSVAAPGLPPRLVYTNKIVCDASCRNTFTLRRLRRELQRAPTHEIPVRAADLDLTDNVSEK